MPRKDKVIHISNLPSTFRGDVTRNGRFIQNGIPPLGGAYDKVAKSTGLIRPVSYTHLTLPTIA